MNYLNTSILKEKVPAAFADSPRKDVSKKYCFLSTEKIINDVIKKGYFPVSADQTKTRDISKRKFARHIIRFRAKNPKRINGYFPEVVLINSHNRKSRLKIMVGLFRIVCSNGLIVSEATFGSVKVIHFGNREEEVERRLDFVLQQFPKVEKRVRIFQKIKLSEKDRKEYLKRATKLRWKRRIPNLDTSLDMVKRKEDKGNSLWNVFNRTQENIFKGNIPSKSKNGRITITRALKSVKKNIKLNEALWSLTEEFANRK